MSQVVLNPVTNRVQLMMSAARGPQGPTGPTGPGGDMSGTNSLSEIVADGDVDLARGRLDAVKRDGSDVTDASAFRDNIGAMTNGLPRIYIAGDSRGAQASAEGRTVARGWMWPLQILTGARFEFQPEFNFALGGDDTQDMLDKVGDLLNVEPGIVVVICSTNDRTGTDTADQSIARMADWQQQVLAHGHKLIWIAETPRGMSSDTTYAMNATRTSYHFRVRRWQLAQAAKPGVYVADTWPTLGALNVTNSWAREGYFYDGLHFGPPAAVVVAEALAPIINTLLPPTPRLIEALGDVWSAQNPTGSLNANPVLAGTGGTAGTGASGTVATSWTVTAGAGLSATCSKIVTDDGLYHGQRIVVSGAPTATNPGGVPVDPTGFAVIASCPLNNLSVSDIIEGTAFIKLHAGQEGARAIALYLTITTASGTTTYCAGEPNAARSFPNLDLPDVELEGVWITPQVEITEAVLSASISVMIVGAPSNGVDPDVTISATVDFTRTAARKVLD